MSEQLPTGQTSAPAEGQAPPHTYIPNHGYASATSQDIPQTPGGYAADIEDESYDDLFEDEEEEYFQDMEYDAGSGDLTKAYNRQRKLNDQSATAPRINPRRTSMIKYQVFRSMLEKFALTVLERGIKRTGRINQIGLPANKSLILAHE